MYSSYCKLFDPISSSCCSFSLYSLSMSVWSAKLMTSYALTLIFNQCPGCISSCFLLNFPSIFLTLRLCVMSQTNPRQNDVSLSSLTNQKSKFSEPNFLLIYPEMLVPIAPSTLMELPKRNTAKHHRQLLAFTLYNAADNRLWYSSKKNSNQK